jgi:hypothetical protein
VGEAAVRWRVGLDGRLEVVWLHQIANFNEDKKVNLTWELERDPRYNKSNLFKGIDQLEKRWVESGSIR